MSIPKLTQLRLASNLFSGPIPASISSATNLTLLDLSNNALSGVIPDSLATLVKLTELYALYF